jgi:hypothetical protein
MTENSYKINLPWTEEHEAYCFQYHIPPAAKLIWQCLMREGEIGTEIEPDLAKINAWVAKVRGKGYSHNYLKQMFNILVETRVIQVIKQYSWKVFKLLVRPLDWLKPPKKRREKNLQNSNSSYNLPASNEQSADTGDIQQQQSNIDNNLATLADEGIIFNHDEKEVLDRPENEIRLAIIMFNLQGGFDKIENPEGWIRTCLRKRIWEYPSNYRRLLQRFGNSTEWDDLFPSG